MSRVSFKEFQKLDLRIGQVIEASKVQGSRNLIQMSVHFGEKTLQAVAGLAQQYKPEELINNKYVFLCNLEQKTMMGVTSECMVLAAEDSQSNIVLIRPARKIEVGSKVR